MKIRFIMIVISIIFSWQLALAEKNADTKRISPQEAISAALENIAQFRISDMGPDGDIDYDAQQAAVAYNSVNNEYLVVWAGDDTLNMVDGEFEIFGQRINAATGLEIGTNDFRISDAGPALDPNFDASNPAIAYNSVNNEYLVVWEADDSLGVVGAGESEIYGQRLDAATGAEIGTNDFRISDMGVDGNKDYDAITPEVAYNSQSNVYLVVWSGENGTFADEFEIYGQLLAGSNGSPVGANDFQISTMGPAADTAYDAYDPDVAYNSVQNEFIVVWQGDDLSGTMVEGEYEIFGQRLNAATGSQVGTDDFRISDMGPDGDDVYDAANPAVAFDPVHNKYLVVWNGDDDLETVADELEIFGQFIDGATGASIGTNDFRISEMGPDGETSYDARDADVAYDPVNSEFLVVWHGDTNAEPLVNGENEIFGQRIDAASGTEVGTNDFRLSDMGVDGDPAYDATLTGVAFASATGEFLVVWESDDTTGTLADDELEIYGQRVEGGTGIEVGTNDFRISDMGVDGDIDYDAREAAIAYNSINNEYLVVWEGDDNTGTLVDGETEIFGQRIDASTGAEVGENDFRISDMGSSGDPSLDASKPAVAYNSTNNEYLVVWSGEDGPVAGEFEIYGQRLSGAAAIEIGSNDFQISDMGPDGSDLYDAEAPAVAYNSTNNEYLVVWQGDDNTLPLVDGESEIFGQRISGATGSQLGTNDFRISDMGLDGDDLFDALSPAIAYNSSNNQYLVVWSGEDNSGTLVNGEFEIFGQRLDGATGAQIGTNDFRISDMGPDGNSLYDAVSPAVVHNILENDYLVVWEGDDDTAPLVEGEMEIFGQLLDGSTGSAIGANDFRLSDCGPNGDPTYDAARPAAAYDQFDDKYLVVWEADDNAGNTVDGESEIYGQFVDGLTGSETGTNDFRISVMGLDGEPLFDAIRAAVIANHSNGGFMIVWDGDDGTGSLANDEFEIFGAITGSSNNTYVCGDANSDGTVNVSDAVYIINYVFVGGAPPNPLNSGDANCDGAVNVSDAVYIINYVFVGGNYPCDTNGDGIPDC
jgi:hypothetical protein